MSNKTMSIAAQNAVCLVRIYAYITIGSVIYGILAAHLPFLIGSPWTTCSHCSSSVGCILLFHLYDGPLTLFNLYVAWYGLKRFDISRNLSTYLSLVRFAVSANLAFFTFEASLLYTNLNDGAPEWENIALASIAIMLLGGTMLGIYVTQKLIQED